MKNITYLFFILLASLSIISACSQYDRLQNDPTQSEWGDDESHNAGMNCLSCHNTNNHEAVREGGWFYIGGTVYEDDDGDKPSRSSGTVELWTGPNGTGNPVYSLPIDDKGNFYTTRIIDFRPGLFPILKDKEGKTKAHMSTAIKQGACNSCHGNSTPYLELK